MADKDEDQRPRGSAELEENVTAMTPFPCQTEDPALWFPETGPATRAKRLCAGCPNRLPCLEFAVEHNIEHGIWAGLSPREREPLVRAAGTGGRRPETVLERAHLRKDRTCELDGCDDRHYAQGMCQVHYLRDWRARKAAA